MRYPKEATQRTGPNVLMLGRSKLTDLKLIETYFPQTDLQKLKANWPYGTISWEYSALYVVAAASQSNAAAPICLRGTTNTNYVQYKEIKRNTGNLEDIFRALRV